MEEDEIKAKLLTYATDQKFAQPALFAEYSTKFLLGLKKRYGAFTVRDDIFGSDNDLHTATPYDVAQKEKGKFDLDEFFINRLIRNIKSCDLNSVPKYENNQKSGEVVRGYYDFGHYDKTGKFITSKSLFLDSEGLKESVINGINILKGFEKETENKEKTEQNEKNPKEKTYCALTFNNDDKDEVLLVKICSSEYDNLVNNKLTPEEYNQNLDKLKNSKVYGAFAHEVYHGFEASYDKNNYLQNMGGITNRFYTNSNVSLIKLQRFLCEVIHEYQVCAVLNQEKPYRFPMIFQEKESHASFIMNNVAYEVWCQYGINTDIAELIEAIMGKNTLFYSSFDNKEDFINDFNKRYKDLFNLNWLMNFYCDGLCPLLNINSKKPWDILSAFNYFIANNSSTIAALDAKFVIQAILIDCLNKNVNDLNPNNKSLSMLKKQYEYVKTIPLKVNRLLLQPLEPSKNQELNINEESYIELKRNCDNKQKQIQGLINKLQKQQDSEKAADKE